MNRRKVCVLLAAALAVLCFVQGKAKAKGGSGWVEVRSPNFIVVTDGSTGEARETAQRFETIRQFFESLFNNAPIYPNRPVIVLAADSDHSYEMLAPAREHKRGALKTAGEMLKRPDQDYILIRLSTAGDFEYNLVCHELAHAVLENWFKPLPLWLNEGLAQFYGAISIQQSRVLFGRPNAVNLAILRSEPMLPLPTLLAVNHSSPYYTKEDQGTIFYAETWALTHYLVIKGLHEKRDYIGEYLTLIREGNDPVAAASKAFGNLDALQKTLETYVGHLAFYQVGAPMALKVDKKSFEARKLSRAESEAIRGDFLARIGRGKDAEPMIEDALEQDPSLGMAEQAMALIADHDHETEKAQILYQKAASNCPSCYLARFYYAYESMQHDHDLVALAQDEASFRAFTGLNPTFIPAYAGLAQVYLLEKKDPEQARMFVLDAIAADPQNDSLYVLSGRILLQEGNEVSAYYVAQRAVALAKTPQDKKQAAEFLAAVEQKRAAASRQ